jgi:glyoxalase family protein
VIRYKAGDTALGGIIDLREDGNGTRGRSGAGTVHHIAFRAASDAVQAEMVRKLAQNHGIRATEQKNRD